MLVAISVTVNPKDIARISKRLSKWQGKPLAERMDKAILNGLKLYINPLRAASPGPGKEFAPKDATGNLRASIGVRRLKKRAGEAAAYAVGPRQNKPYKGHHRHLVIRGHLTASGTMTRAQPFVDEVQQALEGQVSTFISEQITRLA